MLVANKREYVRSGPAAASSAASWRIDMLWVHGLYSSLSTACSRGRYRQAGSAGNAHVDWRMGWHGRSQQGFLSIGPQEGTGNAIRLHGLEQALDSWKRYLEGASTSDILAEPTTARVYVMTREHLHRRTRRGTQAAFP